MAGESSPQVLGNRYVLETLLGRGGMGSVYRAVDRLTAQPVALKMVTAPSSRLLFSKMEDSTDVRLALANEFKTLASLRHPYIISVLDYGFDEERQPYFVMELLEGAQNLLKAAQQQPLEGQMRLLLQVLQALAYLHRRGVIHRDLKPDNIAVVNDQVRVLDFGLAVAFDETMKEDESIVGTLPYLAPELLIGEAASKASDLYAVGVIAYELFAGRHPFPMTSINQLLLDIVQTPPSPEPLEVDAPLVTLILRLLSKDPAARYADAADVLREYADLIGQGSQYETAALRESFLQAAHFVGREAELRLLNEPLSRVIQERQGDAWLVGGESGIGKTRLLDELRTQALVKGALALRGQAVSEGGSPYQLWRDVIRRLVVQTELTFEEASILKGLVPDIETLLFREIPDAPPLDAQAAQRRLHAAIVEVLRRQKQALVLLLEDMHWAGSESMALLAYVNQVVHQLPVLVVASYRDDEAPQLPAALPGMNVVALKRLERGAIADLSAAMLGKAGQQQRVVDLLAQQTEGNVFFLVEMVRALAEEAGQLDEVGNMVLPTRIISGGVQQIVRRRLGRVPSQDFPLLQAAAVAGRELDLALLRVIAPENDLERWLTTGLNAAVLNIQNEVWQFAHDKLREGILSDLPEGSSGGLHRQVAGAIEQAYPDMPEKSALLAYHWGQAGDADKELQYSQAAGQQAARSSANIEAIRYYSRALELLLEQPPSPARDTQELLLQLALGDSLIATRGFAAPEVSTTFNRAYALCEGLGDTNLLFPVLWGLWSYYTVAGELHTARSLAGQFLKLATEANHSALMLAGNYLEGATQFWLGELNLIGKKLENFLAFSQRTEDVTFHIAPGEDPEVSCLSYNAWLLYLLGYPEQAAQRSQQGIALARELKRAHSLAFGLGFAAWHHQYRRDTARVEALADESIQLAAEHGFPYWLAAGKILKGYTQVRGGQTETGLAQLEEGLAIWRMTGAKLFKPSFFLVRAEAYHLAGQDDVALETLDEALAAIENTGERINEAEVNRFKGEIVLQQGQAGDAERLFLKAIEVARQQGARAFELRATVCLGHLWDSQGKGAGTRQRLSDLLNSLTEGEGTPDWVDARALLDKWPA